MGSCAGKASKNQMDDDINDNYIYLPKSINNTKAFRELYIEQKNNNNAENLESSPLINNRYSYISANYKRNSFDRFGDDFCELILSYLCLEDKMHFECLNRQWSRCIFNRVFEVDYPLKKIFPGYFDQKKRLIISKKIMRKCHYVKRLKLSPVCDNEILKLISYNYRFIERITLCFNNLNPIKREILNAFSQNCGPRLKYIKISEFSEESFNSESGISLLIVYSNYFPNLREIELSIDSDNSLKYFILLVDIYAETIKSLSLRLKFNSKYTKVEETFGQISRFINLRNINLQIESDKKLELNFSDGVKLLAENCLNLKNISLGIKREITCQTYLFEALKIMPDLNSLRLVIKSEGIKLGSIEMLGKLRNCSLLYILCADLDDDSLANIHFNLPELKSIELLTLKEITDKTLHSLSKIENLKSLKISGTPFRICQITDKGVCDIINNCHNIKIIDFNCGINVTELTFSTLKTLVELSPERRIKFSFCCNRYCGIIKNDELFFFEDEKPEIKKSPENLIIKSREYFAGCGNNMVQQISIYCNQFYNLEIKNDFWNIYE